MATNAVLDGIVNTKFDGEERPFQRRNALTYRIRSGCRTARCQTSPCLSKTDRKRLHLAEDVNDRDSDDSSSNVSLSWLKKTPSVTTREHFYFNDFYFLRVRTFCSVCLDGCFFAVLLILCVRMCWFQFQAAFSWMQRMDWSKYKSLTINIWYNVLWS
jgi:hypothetical protein